MTSNILFIHCMNLCIQPLHQKRLIVAVGIHEVLGGNKWMGSLDLMIWTKQQVDQLARASKQNNNDNKQDKQWSKTSEARRARLLGA